MLRLMGTIRVSLREAPSAKLTPLNFGTWGDYPKLIPDSTEIVGLRMRRIAEPPKEGSGARWRPGPGTQCQLTPRPDDY